MTELAYWRKKIPKGLEIIQLNCEVAIKNTHHKINIFLK